MSTPEEIEGYSKELIEEAKKKGISRLDLLSSIIIEPVETVKEYLPDLDKEARETSNKCLFSLDKETLKTAQKNLGLTNEKVKTIQKLTPSEEDAIKILTRRILTRITSANSFI